MSYELKNYSFGQTIGKSFNLYLNNFIPLAIISFILLIPSSIFNYHNTFLQYKSYFLIGTEIYNPSDSSIYITIIEVFLNFTLSSILSGFIIQIVSKKYLHKKLILKDYFQLIKLLIPLFLLSMVVNFFIFIGLIAFIFPGLMLMTEYSLAANCMVTEKLRVFPAMRRSYVLTKNNRWRIFGQIILLGLSVFIISFAIYLLINYFMLKQLHAQNISGLHTQVILYSIVTHFTTSILAPINSCLLVIIYFNMRVKKEAFNIEHLSEQFTITRDEISPSE